MMCNLFVFSRNHASNFEFRSFLGLGMCGTVISLDNGDTGQRQRATAPGQPRDHEGE